MLLPTSWVLGFIWNNWWMGTTPSSSGFLTWGETGGFLEGSKINLWGIKMPRPV